METSSATARRSPWAWVPTLYLAEGIPYVVVNQVSVIMFKRLGISNTDIALYTAWLYLPWVIKPLWSPLVDMVRTKRVWIILLQLVVGAALAGVALTITLPDFFRYSLAVLWLLAFSSATHDIAADGFYMLGLEGHQQAAFVGVRNTFYRLAMIAGQGGLVVVAGQLELTTGGRIAYAWSIAFIAAAALFVLLVLYHKFMLPRPASDTSVRTAEPLKDFLNVFALFFRKQRIGAILAFLLLYRLGESQLIKLVSPFLLDPAAEGGLGLSTSEVGIAYGTFGIVALLLGGVLGGYVISRRGLKFWLWPMVFCIHLPDLVFVYLSQVQPSSFPLICGAVAVEQFGYGFGFTAYTLFMILVAEGNHKTAHFALCTGFMALGMMLPGMASGAIQDWLGYRNFFLWVVFCTVPGFVAASRVSIPPGFGAKKPAASEASA